MTGYGGSVFIDDPRQMTEDTHYQVLKILEQYLQASQRELLESQS